VAANSHSARAGPRATGLNHPAFLDLPIKVLAVIRLHGGTKAREKHFDVRCRLSLAFFVDRPDGAIDA
jgi:hypothetical protein